MYFKNFKSKRFWSILLVILICLVSGTAFAEETDLGDGVYLLDEAVDPDSVAVKVKIDADQLTKLTTSNLRHEELRKISTVLYNKFNDDFDYIFFVMNKPSAAVQLPNTHISVRNNVSGINKAIGTWEDFGSRVRLKSIIHFYTAESIPSVALHEFVHAWGHLYVKMLLKFFLRAIGE